MNFGALDWFVALFVTAICFLLVMSGLEMVQNVGDADLEMQMLEGFLLYPLMVDLRFQRWDEILKTPAPRAERKLLHAFWQFARAMALVGQAGAGDEIAESTLVGIRSWAFVVTTVRSRRN